MSDQVNSFADLVAYGQHGPGHPVQDAGQEATRGVAGQVNADNGIADQGNSGAAATPALTGQAAKDPPHRPDDAKPFQCVSEIPFSLWSQHTDTTAGYHC